MRLVKHLAFVLALLVVTVLLPAAFTVDVGAFFSDDGTDAVTTASLDLPDQPSGEFLVLLNAGLHENTLNQWRLFFAGEDAGVIMSDLSCRVADGDALALQLARRYQARLPENQMTVKSESGLLVVSRAESGEFDCVVLSKEAAEAYGLTQEILGTERILVKGE